MARIRIALDTSALVSLGCGDILPYVFQAFDCWSTLKVQEELRDIARIPDRFGIVAKSILEGDIHFVKVKPQAIGELEVVELANQETVEAVFMDDVPARRKLQPKCKRPILFSPTIIYYLCLKNVLLWEEGWNIVERMAAQRTWKNSIIYESAKQEWNHESIA